MKTIESLLTPRIESENVKYDTLIGYSLPSEKVISDENSVEITEEKIVIKGRGKDELALGEGYIKQLSLIFNGSLPVCSFSFYCVFLLITEDSMGLGVITQLFYAVFTGCQVSDNLLLCLQVLYHFILIPGRAVKL